MGFENVTLQNAYKAVSFNYDGKINVPIYAEPGFAPLSSRTYPQASAFVREAAGKPVDGKDAFQSDSQDSAFRTVKFTLGNGLYSAARELALDAFQAKQTSVEFDKYDGFFFGSNTYQ